MPDSKDPLNDAENPFANLKFREDDSLNRAEVENPACDAVVRDECRKSLVEAFEVFGRKDAGELRQKYSVVAVE
jgi:hypothetical protein